MKISKLNFLLPLLTLVFCGNIVLAQDEQEEELSLESGPLQNQFEYLIEESNNYQQYEVIPKDWMQTFKASLKDSLAAISTEIKDLNSQIDEQEETISSLETKLKGTEGELAETQNAMDSMNFVGTVPMKKPFYRVVIWSIIGGLLLLLLIFIFRFNRSNSVTKDVKGKLAELQDEMEQQKKRALEREQKLSRELQDERNKNRK
ncbi:tRNA (guanine-N1)-methyltransferase [Halocola ammonii]